MDDRSKAPKDDVRQLSRDLQGRLQKLEWRSDLAKTIAKNAIERSRKLLAKSEEIDELANELLKAS